MNELIKLSFFASFLGLLSCQTAPKESVNNETDASSTTVQLCTENPRYLEYKGEPVVLITSAEHYGAVLNLDFDYKLYLETLGAEGFNYTRIFTGTYFEPVENIFNIRKNTLAPEPSSFLAPWIKEGGKYDLTQFNPGYFERLKDFITEAEKQGIVVEVTLFTSIYAEGQWALCPFNAANNVNGVGEVDFREVNTMYNGGLKQIQESYVRKMVQELNEFDNFFFEVQNEPYADNGCLASFTDEADDLELRKSVQRKVVLSNGLALDWQEWVVSLIVEEEAELPIKHLIAQNISNIGYDLDALPKGVSIVNFHYAIPDAAQMNLDLGGVIGLDETGFMPQDDQLYIDQAWRFILSGGGLYNNLDYSFTAEFEQGDWPIPEGNPGWGGPEFRRKLSILLKTMKQVPFQEMDFSGNILDASQGDFKQYGLAREGEVYVLFVENLNSEKLIPGVPASEYEVIFIQIDSGEKQNENLELGQGQALSLPFESERIAIIIRKSE